ncbi:hypothetical protein HY417_00305 [Candidatus Kaiserbacteria bacterium]|nr:hypothetical protein [Candidatus Kaiserbacteria bacterium]
MSWRLPAFLLPLLFAALVPLFAHAGFDKTADDDCKPVDTRCGCGEVWDQKLKPPKCRKVGKGEANMHKCECTSKLKPAGGFCRAQFDCKGTWYTDQDGKKQSPKSEEDFKKAVGSLPDSSPDQPIPETPNQQIPSADALKEDLAQASNDVAKYQDALDTAAFGGDPDAMARMEQQLAEAQASQADAFQKLNDLAGSESPQALSAEEAIRAWEDQNQLAAERQALYQWEDQNQQAAQEAAEKQALYQWDKDQADTFGKNDQSSAVDPEAKPWWEKAWDALQQGGEWLGDKIAEAVKDLGDQFAERNDLGGPKEPPTAEELERIGKQAAAENLQGKEITPSKFADIKTPYDDMTPEQLAEEAAAEEAREKALGKEAAEGKLGAPDGSNKPPPASGPPRVDLTTPQTAIDTLKERADFFDKNPDYPNAETRAAEDRQTIDRLTPFKDSYRPDNPAFNDGWDKSADSAVKNNPGALASERVPGAEPSYSAASTPVPTGSGPRAVASEYGPTGGFDYPDMSSNAPAQWLQDAGFSRYSPPWQADVGFTGPTDWSQLALGDDDFGSGPQGGVPVAYDYPDMSSNAPTPWLQDLGFYGYTPAPEAFDYPDMSANAPTPWLQDVGFSGYTSAPEAFDYPDMSYVAPEYPLFEQNLLALAPPEPIRVIENVPSTKFNPNSKAENAGSVNIGKYSGKPIIDPKTGKPTQVAILPQSGLKQGAIVDLCNGDRCTGPRVVGDGGGKVIDLTNQDARAIGCNNCPLTVKVLQEGFPTNSRDPDATYGRFPERFAQAAAWRAQSVSGSRGVASGYGPPAGSAQAYYDAFGSSYSTQEAASGADAYAAYQSGGNTPYSSTQFNADLVAASYDYPDMGYVAPDYPLFEQNLLSLAPYDYPDMSYVAPYDYPDMSYVEPDWSRISYEPGVDEGFNPIRDVVDDYPLGPPLSEVQPYLASEDEARAFERSIYDYPNTDVLSQGYEPPSDEQRDLNDWFRQYPQRLADNLAQELARAREAVINWADQEITPELQRIAGNIALDEQLNEWLNPDDYPLGPATPEEQALAEADAERRREAEEIAAKERAQETQVPVRIVRVQPVVPESQGRDPKISGIPQEPPAAEPQVKPPGADCQTISCWNKEQGTPFQSYKERAGDFDVVAKKGEKYVGSEEQNERLLARYKLENEERYNPSAEARAAYAASNVEAPIYGPTDQGILLSEAQSQSPLFGPTDQGVLLGEQGPIDWKALEFNEAFGSVPTSPVTGVEPDFSGVVGVVEPIQSELPNLGEFSPQSGERTAGLEDFSSLADRTFADDMARVLQEWTDTRLGEIQAAKELVGDYIQQSGQQAEQPSPLAGDEEYLSTPQEREQARAEAEQQAAQQGIKADEERRAAEATQEEAAEKERQQSVPDEELARRQEAAKAQATKDAADKAAAEKAAAAQAEAAKAAEAKNEAQRAAAAKHVSGLDKLQKASASSLAGSGQRSHEQNLEELRAQQRLLRNALQDVQKDPNLPFEVKNLAKIEAGNANAALNRAAAILDAASRGDNDKVLRSVGIDPKSVGLSNYVQATRRVTQYVKSQIGYATARGVSVANTLRRIGR